MIRKPTLHRRQAARARGWLASVPFDSNATEACIQRLFGICASLVLDSTCSTAVIQTQLRQFAAQLGGFQHYGGDPVIALSLRRLLARWGISHPNLNDYYHSCRKLEVPPGVFESKFNLFFDLSDRSPPLPKSVDVEMPSIGSLVQNGRAELLSVCGMLLRITSFGTRPLNCNAKNLSEVLPRLSCSYATDWDLSATCVLLRTCAYLRLTDSAPCLAAMRWVLDQQRADGRFGLLLPKNCRPKGTAAELMDADFLPTVDALWMFAEIHYTGFILAAHCEAPCT